MTLAAAGLLLPSVTGSAETVMRPFALASGIYKREKRVLWGRQLHQVLVSDMLVHPLVKLAVHVGH